MTVIIERLRELGERIKAGTISTGDKDAAVCFDAAEQIGKFRTALAFYAHPKNWWNENVYDRLNYHNADLRGSVERMNAKVGVIQKAGTNNLVHDRFFNDGGDRARAALKP